MPLLHPVLSAELWPNVLRHLGVADRSAKHDIQLQDAATMRRATLAGLGIGLISMIDAAEDLKLGKLVAPFGQKVMHKMPTSEVPGFYLVVAESASTGEDHRHLLPLGRGGRLAASDDKDLRSLTRDEPDDSTQVLPLERFS